MAVNDFFHFNADWEGCGVLQEQTPGRPAILNKVTSNILPRYGYE